MNVITNIEVQKGNKNRFNIYVDNEYAFSLSDEIIYKEGIKINQKIDIEKVKNISNKDNYLKCKNTALRIIERSFKSERELRNKLILKGYDNKAIDKTINFLKEYSFISDDSYTKMYINDKIRTQGKNKIKYDLIKKGINENIIKEEFSNINKDIEMESAYNLAIKKYKIIDKKEGDKLKLSQKLYRYLLSRGYDYDTVSCVVKKITNINDM